MRYTPKEKGATATKNLTKRLSPIEALWTMQNTSTAKTRGIPLLFRYREDKCNWNVS